MNRPSAIMHLSHAQISSTVTDVAAANDRGSSWVNGRQSTIYAVNLREVLGTEWNKYGEYEISLIQSAASRADFANDADLDHQLTLQISGLPFIRCTYSAKTGQQTGFWPCVLLNVSDNIDQVVSYSYGNATANFSACPENIRIQIDLLQSATGNPGEYGIVDLFPMQSYIFAIKGIEQTRK